MLAPPEEIALLADLLVEMPFGKTQCLTGIYFLVDCGRVVYIGMTSVGPHRAMSHVGKKAFDRALFLQVPAAEHEESFSLANLETAFIRMIRPRLNGNHQVKCRPWRPNDVNLDAWYGGRREQEKARLRGHRDASNNEMRERIIAKYGLGHPAVAGFDETLRQAEA